MTSPADDDQLRFSAQRARDYAAAPTLKLQDEERKLSITDQIALGDAKIRRNIAYGIMSLFAVVNIATLVFLHALFLTDQADLAAKLINANGRVVNSHVLMTLLGATTVQLGTIMVIMARYLFRSPVDGGEV